MKKTIDHIVFDLDDTIYKERDFIRSAYNHIVNYINENYGYDVYHLIEISIKNNFNLYDNILNEKNINLTLEKYLELYRFHYPKISLDENTLKLINNLKDKGIKMSIITDGRSITQRNKINALGIFNELTMIIISEETGYEKPHKHNFTLIQDAYPGENFIYVGDNTEKDFIAPNKLGWDTVCLLDDGRNIHYQSFDLNKSFLPKRSVNSLIDLVL